MQAAVFHFQKKYQKELDGIRSIGYNETQTRLQKAERGGLCLVSVVIPIYNVEKYLAECVESVLNQTYTDLEIILVDDGSPDHCGAICDAYAKKDSRIKVIHKENGGLSDARNAGLDTAQGRYVYFPDSDDYIKEDAIEKLVKLADSQNADMVFFNALLFCDNRSDFSTDWIQKGPYAPGSGVDLLRQRLHHEEWFPGIPLHFYRLDFIRHYNLKFKKGIFYEDQVFSVSAFLSAEKVCFLNDALYFYRQQRDGSIMTNKASAKGFISYIVCIRELLKEKVNRPQNSPEVELLETIIAGLCNAALNCYADMDAGSRKQVGQELRYLHKATCSLKRIPCQKLRFKTGHPELWLRCKKAKGFIKHEDAHES